MKHESIGRISGILAAAGIEDTTQGTAKKLFNAMANGGLLKEDQVLDGPPKVEGICRPNQLDGYFRRNSFEGRHSFLSGVFSTLGLQADHQQIGMVIEGLENSEIIKFERF